jgi:hypothetical protein
VAEIPESNDVAVQPYINCLRDQMLELAKLAGVPERVVTGVLDDARLDDGAVIRR